MQHLQSKVLLKSIEIPVIVQQSIAFSNTERRDQAVNRFADRDTSATQTHVVFGGCNREFFIPRIKYLKLEQVLLKSLKSRLIPNSLQDLAEDQTGESDRF